jgi:hypothetical protein
MLPEVYDNPREVQRRKFLRQRCNSTLELAVFRV